MSSPLDLALNLARSRTERSVESLAALVRIRSLTGEEGAAQAHMARLLQVLGAEVTCEEPDVQQLFQRYPQVAQYPTHWQHDLILPYAHLPSYEALLGSGLEGVLNYRQRPNVVGLLRGSGEGSGRSLILNGHVDTVTVEPTGEWRHDPFGAELHNGLMYGRGTSDMKGGLMAALMALTCLREAGIHLRGDVIYQCVVNEEHAGNGTLDLVRRGCKADAAIVLEPTGNTVAVGHTGGLYWQVSILGVPRSPGARWRGEVQDGVSAIEKLPCVIEALLGMERDCNARRSNDVLEQGRAPFSLVIGKVQGGHYETVTAGEVLLKGGAYFSPQVGSIGEVMQRFTTVVAQAAAGDAFLREHPPRVEFLHHDDSVRQDSGIEVAQSMTAALQRRGGSGRIHPGPFCCDMRHLVNQAGIPSIIFGPGSIAQAHKADEHIVVAEYLTGIEHLIEFIHEWCMGEGSVMTGLGRGPFRSG